MEIHIKDGEELVIFAKTPDDQEKTLTISYKEMMSRGEALIDGLTTSEIDALTTKRKILAIKLHRSRIGCGLKESKEAVEKWVNDNQCCKAWPYCEHTECIQSLDLDQLLQQNKGLCITWFYGAALTKEQCQGLMAMRRYPHKTYGFYSYHVENNTTRWACNSQTG